MWQPAQGVPHLYWRRHQSPHNPKQAKDRTWIDGWIKWNPQLNGIWILPRRKFPDTKWTSFLFWAHFILPQDSLSIPNLDQASIFPQLVTGLLASWGDLEAYAPFHLLLTHCFPKPFLCQWPSAFSPCPLAGNMSTSNIGHGSCTNWKKESSL